MIAIALAAIVAALITATFVRLDGAPRRHRRAMVRRAWLVKTAGRGER